MFSFVNDKLCHYLMSDCLRNDQSFESIKYNNSINTRHKRMYCYNCGEYTQSIEPLIIRKYKKSVFAILSMCNKCKKLKQCSFSTEHHVKFPSYYFDSKSSKFYFNEIDNNNKNKKFEKDLFDLIIKPFR